MPQFYILTLIMIATGEVYTFFRFKIFHARICCIKFD